MAFSRKDIESARAKRLATMKADRLGKSLTGEERRRIYQEEKAKHKQVALSEEERQQIYEEEKAKEERGGLSEEEATRRNTRAISFFVGFVLFLVSLGFIAMNAETEQQQAAEAAQPERTVAQLAQEERQAERLAEKQAERERQRAAELTVCKTSLQCWGDRHAAMAGSVCRDSVERLAKYSHEWTDGWLGSKFTHFRWKSKPDVITFVGDKVKFQNGFGAWQNMVYECDMNVETNRALAVRVRPGRLG